MISEGNPNGNQNSRSTHDLEQDVKTYKCKFLLIYAGVWTILIYLSDNQNHDPLMIHSWLRITGHLAGTQIGNGFEGGTAPGGDKCGGNTNLEWF